MLRRVTKFVADWWRAMRASLLRTARPWPDGTTSVPATMRHLGEQPTTSLDELEAFLRELYGSQSVLRKVNKLNDHDFDLIVNVGQHDQLVLVRRDGRKWKTRTS